MSITYQIPHDSRFLTTTNIFQATFNAVTPGKYSFTGQLNGAGALINKGQQVYLLQNDKILLIERMSVGGDISEEQYLEAIDILPSMRLRKSKTNEAVYFRSHPIVNYMDNKEIVAWVDSTKQAVLQKNAGSGHSVINAIPVTATNDNLIMDFDGVLSQTPALVGKVTIKINITLSIYIITSTEFYKRIKEPLSPDIGKQVQGTLK